MGSDGPGSQANAPPARLCGVLAPRARMLPMLLNGLSSKSKRLGRLDPDAQICQCV
jgi:hypothetical protein